MGLFGDFKLDNTYRVDRIKVCTDAGMSTQDAVIAHDAAVEAVTEAFKAADANLSMMPEGIIRDAAKGLVLKMMEANAHVLQEEAMMDAIIALLTRTGRRTR